MNKKGFTLIELLAAIVIISLILMIVYPSITKISDENSTKMYKTYEDMMVEYAKASPLNDQYRIYLDDLDELDKIKNECDGYVLIDHDKTPPEYKAYIKCGEKYETDGYVLNDA